MQRVIAIGDIHGCYHTLKNLWDRICPNEEDVIIFIGDYIDRGLYSFEVIKFLEEKRKEYPNLILLKGNHEDLCEKAIIENDSYLWYYNGGYATQLSFENNQVKLSTILKFINSLDTFVILEDFNMCFVHAGLGDAKTPEEQEEKTLLWDRTFRNNSDYLVVCGHTRHKEPTEYHRPSGVLCIDTGCVADGKLTAAIFNFKDTSLHSTDFISMEKVFEDNLGKF